MDHEGTTLKELLPVEAYAHGAVTLLSQRQQGAMTIVTLAFGRGDRIEIQTIVDPTNIAEACRAQANEFSKNDRTPDGLQHYGSVPTVIRDRMLREGWDDRALQRWFDENPAFKVVNDSRRLA